MQLCQALRQVNALLISLQKHTGQFQEARGPRLNIRPVMRDVNHGLSQYLSFDRSTSAGRRYRRLQVTNTTSQTPAPRLFPPSGVLQEATPTNDGSSSVETACAGRVQSVRDELCRRRSAGDPIQSGANAQAATLQQIQPLHNFDTRYRDRDVAMFSSLSSLPQIPPAPPRPSSSHSARPGTPSTQHPTH